MDTRGISGTGWASSSRGSSGRVRTPFGTRFMDERGDGLANVTRP